MSHTFKDYFSKDSSAYAAFRPVYPKALFEFLVSLCNSHDLAWDCATGNGQSAICLSDYFKQVVATDASQNQIENAFQKKNIEYRVEQAENSSLGSSSVDLLTVAQALHWFDRDLFALEARRVLKREAVLAVWTYGFLCINEGIDKIVNHLYGVELDDFWSPERRLVEGAYSNISLPLKEKPGSEFQLEMEWDLSQLMGYLETWSAVKKYIAKNKTNPVTKYHQDMIDEWGIPTNKRKIIWPIKLRIWIND